MPPAQPITKPEPVPTIELDELRRRLDDPALTIVDVLARESYLSAHLPGAISLPVAEIETRAPGMLPDRGADIAVYCSSAT